MPEITVTTDLDNEEPVYRQVARQIRQLIAHGEIPAGYRLPSVRTLASDLGVNLNTIARAYRVLEEEGFVVICGRSGVEVAPPKGIAMEDSSSAPIHLLQILREVLARLRQAGIGPSELRRLVTDEIKSMPERTRGMP